MIPAIVVTLLLLTIVGSTVVFRYIKQRRNKYVCPTPEMITEANKHPAEGMIVLMQALRRRRNPLLRLWDMRLRLQYR